MSTVWEKNSWEVRRGEEKLATERRREYTDFGSHLRERDKHVDLHAPALALAVTDEACWEAEI